MSKENRTMTRPVVCDRGHIVAGARPRAFAVLFAVLLGTLALGVSPALGEFGIQSFDGSITDQNGNPFTQAGGHPFEISTTIDFNTTTDSQGNTIPDGNFKDIRVNLPAGLVGDPSAT